MASRADLYRAGMDGFAIIEEYIEKRGRPATGRRSVVHKGNSCFYQPSQSVVHQVKPVSQAEEKMEYYEAAQFLGAASTMDYSKRKSRHMGY